MLGALLISFSSLPAAAQVSRAAHTPGITITHSPAAASRPPATLPPPPADSGPRDLFKADAETYAPSYDHLQPMRHFRHPPLLVSSALTWTTYLDERPREDARPPARASEPRTENEPNTSREPVARTTPPPTAVMARLVSTLYVIPRCYAGDRRPTALDLRPGCSLKDLRELKILTAR